MLLKSLALLLTLALASTQLACSEVDESTDSTSMVDSVLGENEPEELDIRGIMDGANSE